jgi:hypothetical protein
VAELLDCRDLSQAHWAVAYSLRLDDSVPLINHDNVIIWKIWLVEYAVFHHRPFNVKH